MHHNTFLFYISISSISMGSGALAQNKFLTPTVEEVATSLSCSAPIGMVAIASNLAPRDIYLARTSPSSESDYIQTFLEDGTRVFLVQDYMTTTDLEVAELCSQIDGGDVSGVLLDRLEAAIASNLLWWPIDAGKDIFYGPSNETWGEEQRQIAYVSAKHINFISPDEWDLMTAPNALGYIYISFERNTYPLPIARIEGVDTANAYAVAADTKPNMRQCIFGYSISDMYRAFSTQEEDEFYVRGTMPANQTDFRIDDGIWPDCIFGDEIVEGDPRWEQLSHDSNVSVGADCIAGTISGYEIDAGQLPVSLWNGLGTNFALLCPEKTVEILQTDCEQGNEYSCDSLATFLEQ